MATTPAVGLVTIGSGLARPSGAAQRLVERPVIAAQNDRLARIEQLEHRLRGQRIDEDIYTTICVDVVCQDV